VIAFTDLIGEQPLGIYTQAEILILAQATSASIIASRGRRRALSYVNMPHNEWEDS